MRIFTKLNVGDTVASSGTRVFKKLTTEEPLPIWNGTDLTGTKWKIKSGWSAEAGYGEFDVGGISWDIEGKVGAGYTRLCIGYSTDSPIPDSTLFPATNSIVFRSLFNGIMSDTTVGRSFSFTYGTDLTNKSLINWLLENGELTSHTYVPVTAGLYDANDNLVASWDTLVNTYGMDGIEEGYGIWNTELIPESPCYILKNNSELSVGTKLVIPDSITNIGEGAFSECSTLTSLIIPGSVTSIANRAFANCSALTSIVIPDRVTTINYSLFFGCTNLTSVTIPNGVTFIDSTVFYGCTNLTDVYFKGTEEQWAAITIDDSNGNLNNATIHYNYTG